MARSGLCAQDCIARTAGPNHSGTRVRRSPGVNAFSSNPEANDFISPRLQLSERSKGITTRKDRTG
jgi:hypothetical protein